MLRQFGAALLLASLVSSTTAFAAGQDTALAGGKPAGVKAAQSSGPGLTLTVIGIAVVAGGIALVASGSDDQRPTATTTTTFVAP